ncbi:MAG: hypothetical protein WC787_03650 [Patescibacteria group bacterium]|jgi:hypothetical protein
MSRIQKVLYIGFFLSACVAYPEDNKSNDGGNGEGGSSEGGSNDGGSSSDGGNGEGGAPIEPATYSCSDVPSGHLAVKVRTEVVPDNGAIMIEGGVYPLEGSGLPTINWDVLATGGEGAEILAFDAGEMPSGSRTQIAPGTAYDGQDGIGIYYCPDVKPWVCPNTDILCCYGTTVVSEYLDAEAVNTFTWSTDNPNPICVAP